MDNYSIVNLDVLGRRIPEEETYVFSLFKIGIFFLFGRRRECARRQIEASYRGFQSPADPLKMSLN